MKISLLAVSNVIQMACGEYWTRTISEDEESFPSTVWDGPPSGVTSRIDRCCSGPLTNATFRPSGCQTGKLPSGANLRGCPPNFGTTQMSPPYVRPSWLPIRWPIFTIPVRDARVETKAIELPSGETAG